MWIMRARVLPFSEWCCCCLSVPPGSPVIESREDVVSEGNETELTCIAMGGKPAASIRWMKGEEELTGRWNNSLPQLASHAPGLSASPQVLVSGGRSSANRKEFYFECALYWLCWLAWVHKKTLLSVIYWRTIILLFTKQSLRSFKEEFCRNVTKNKYITCCRLIKKLEKLNLILTNYQVKG